MWSPGDTVELKIPLDVRLVPDGDKTTEYVAFVRGPQVLATDTAIDAGGGLPESGWWGDDLYSCTVKQNGVEKEFHLVNFADAGQNKEEYAVLHEGIETPSAIKDTDPAEEVLAALRGFAEAMEARGHGGIIQLSSISGHMSMPFMAEYSASKAYQLALGEALHYELKDDGIDVLVLSPGATRSERVNFGMQPQPVVARALSQLGKRPSSIPGLANSWSAFKRRHLRSRKAAVEELGRFQRGQLKNDD